MAKKKESSMDTAPAPGERDYETEGHLRTLMDAESIKADPAKMKKVMSHASKQKQAITSIQGLRDTYKAKFGQNAQMKRKQEDGDDSDVGT